MDLQKTYPFLKPLLSPFHAKQRATLALMIAAIAITGQARSFAIATTVARWLHIRLDSAVNRFYRLLRNPRIDYLIFVEKWAQLLIRGKERHLLIAVDWTEWHHDLRLLAAAVVTGKRAIPLFVQAFTKLVPRRSQNTRENTFLRLLADALKRAQITATILCDRGFRRVSWLKLLDQLNFQFVVRLITDVHVQLPDETQLALSDILLFKGKVVDLGFVQLRSDGACAVRIIGYWAKGASEPWWIATNLTASASLVLRIYDRRMTVEEQFRDTKGKRFGVKLAWTQFRDPQALSHFCMLLAVALLIWLITGAAAAQKHPSLRLCCRTKGPRQSFVTIGLRSLAVGDPLPISLPVITRFLEPPFLRPLTPKLRGGK